ncbi:MAG: hypothetical protein NZV14_09595 [Bryobacteraceae bacterium]|nr:hypothetical protein [Bryobacteraceae bacterium]MDW8378405.1 hypothetical protein [Bryobacterales bacterium]
MILAVALNASVTVLSTLQLILAGLSLQAMYQVSAEVASRGRAERLSNAQLNEEPLVWAPSSAATVRKLSTPRGASGAHTPAPRPAENNSVGAEQVEIGELEQSTLRATAELLLLLGAVTASSEMSSVRATVKKHVSLSRAK